MKRPKIELAGFNIPIDEIRAKQSLDSVLTPEIMSATYARISRDPRPIAELRKDARKDVEKARALCERVVFGFGHHSVAEHAVFNFDIEGVSRLAVEAIERHRLASYTERSQRYQKIGRDYVMPEEILGKGLAQKFQKMVVQCFDAYERCCEALESSGVPPKKAQEDARYLLPLATASELGLTANAREIEYMIMCFLSNPLNEVKVIGREMLAQAQEVAPSLVRYVEPKPYVVMLAERVRSATKRTMCRTEAEDQGSADDVRLICATKDGDDIVLGVLLSAVTGMPLDKCVGALKKETVASKQRLFLEVLEGITEHDPLPREFEHLTMTFEIVISAAAFGQLKRHRMCTLSAAPYDPSLGIRVPKTFSDAGLEGLLDEVARESVNMANELGDTSDPHVAYCLLNAHQRRVLVTMNLRELYHMTRLRLDSHAQWDIREIVEKMALIAQQVFPVCSLLLGGKDQFAGLLKHRLESCK
jgi:flavin-dependent thymidylate synthase